MADVTGTIGSEPVELNNIATEASLRIILSTLQRQNQYLLQNQKALTQISTNTGKTVSSGTQPGGQQAQQAAKGLGQVAEEATGVAKNLSPLAKGAIVLGGIVGDLAASAFKTVGNLTDLAGSLIDGQGSVSDFYASLRDLPLGLGMVAGLFEKIAKLQQAELEQYRKLTDAGINFGGQLNQVRQSALDLGMTMDQFSTLMTRNSDVFNLLGGSVNDGAKAFVKIAKDLRDSPVGRDLRALGYTSEQASEGLANYIRMTGGRSVEEMKNTKALTASAGEYLKQLDLMSQLTGQSREEQEKALKEQTKNAAWQNYLSTLDEKGREKAIASLQASLAKGGKGAADALQSKLLGLPPMTEEAQTFTAMAGEAAGSLDDYVNAVKDSSKGINDVNKATAKLTYNLAKEGEKIGPNFGAALIAGGGAIGQFASLSLAAQTELKNKGIKTQEDYEKFMANLQKKQEAQSKSAASQAAESEKALKDMGAAIYGALQPALAAITPVVNDLAQSFMEFAQDNMPAIKEALTEFTVLVSNFAKNLFSDAGREKIVNDISYYLKLMFIEIKKAILPSFMYNEEDAKRDRAKLGIEKESYDRKAEVARLEMENSQKLKALEIKKSEGGVAGLEKEIENNNKSIEDLQKKKDKEGELFSAEDQAKLEELERQKKKQERLLELVKDDKALAAAEAAKKDIENKKTEAEKLTTRSETIKRGDETISGKGGALTGAATLGLAGAAIGSVVPVIGTAIGGAIGAALGGVAGGLGLIDYGISGGEVSSKEVSKYNPVEKRALGGPVDANTPYWVGERGPELFKPKVPGEIVDSSASQSSMTNIDFAKSFKSLLPSPLSMPFEGISSIIEKVYEKSKAPAQTGKTETAFSNLFSNKDSGANEPGEVGGTISSDQAKTLISELQTLNKLTNDMLRYTREVADYTKRNVDATTALNGNLLT